MDLLRESTIGQLFRLITGKRFLLYPEEQAVFTLNRTRREKQGLTFLQPATFPSGYSAPDAEQPAWSGRCSEQKPHTRDDNENSNGDEVTFIVGWYGPHDPANPQNWSTGKKSLVTAVLWLYTFTVYCASAIYTPSTQGVVLEYGVSHTTSSLGLSLYVLGYGVGPLIFSPLSEIPRLGRNVPYMSTSLLFLLLSIPTAMVRSLPAFLVLRFLTGFMGSPCLATGGATLQDMYSSMKLPYGYTAWVGATFCAPALGPVISAFIVAHHEWRWALWEVLWMALLTFIVMVALLPETSSGTILFHRAQRLRRHFQDDRFRSQAEMEQKNSTLRQTVVEALLRPLQITVSDPAVFFTNLYSSYSYGVYYSFFEAFSLVYTDIHGFSLGLTGAAFLSIVVACLVGTIIYVSYVRFYLEPKLKKHGPGPQEERLVPAVYASLLQPVGLFLFAWSSRADIHWIVSMIGVALFSTGGFILFQGIFMYLPLSYPRYAASLFAANDFFRSLWAAAAVLYATPLFEGLGIARGVSLLGGLSVGGVLGVTALYYYGGRLRAKSHFAES